MFKKDILKRGIFKDINTAKRIAKSAQQINSKTLLEGNDNIPPNVKDFIKKFGNEKIASLSVGRTLVNPIIQQSINTLSNGGLDYDIYHLFLNITTTSGKKLMIEKNERLNAGYENPQGEKLSIPSPNNLTISELLENTRKYMGDHKFVNYQAFQNNCQDFIISVLTANNIPISQEMRDFIKQDVSHLSQNRPLSMLANR